MTAERHYFHSPGPEGRAMAEALVRIGGAMAAMTELRPEFDLIRTAAREAEIAGRPSPGARSGYRALQREVKRRETEAWHDFIADETREAAE